MILLVLPLLTILFVDPVAFDYHAIKFLAGAAGAAILFGVALARRRLYWTQVSLALWIFLGARGLMLVRSPMPGESVRWFALLLGLACVHHAVGPVDTEKQARIQKVLGLLLAALSVYAIVQHLSGARQANALFANRNFAGAGLAMLLPFAIALNAWLLPLGLLGIYATQSRGGALAAACALALWFAWTRPRLRLPLLIGVPAVVLAGALLLGDTNTVKVRLHWYRAALDMGLSKPLAGEGAGGFAREYPPHRDVEEHAISGGLKVHAVHNDYLESWAEGGVPGLGAHVLLLVVLLRAARKHRGAACSLLAFAVASLVDLPLRDPALLCLSFASIGLLGNAPPSPGPFPLKMTWLAAPALVAVVALVPTTWWHWRADHLYGRFLESHDPVLLDAALSRDPDHPEALLERSRPRDLVRLLAKEPHNAAALYNATKDLFEPEAIEALETLLLEHDPHHTLTRVRLAVLKMKTDPIAAASILDDAIDADPRPYLPHAVLAQIHREAGRLDMSERFLEEAEKRSDALGVRQERLELELAFRRGKLTDAARRLPDGELRHRVGLAFARAQAVEEANPRPRLKRDEGESDVDFAARVQQAQEAWAEHVLSLVRADYAEASDLAAALVVNAPSAVHFHLLARAERGRRNRKTADHAEGFALFLETLDHLGKGDEAAAKQSFVKALRTHPGLLADETVPQAIRLYMRAHPAARPLARELFSAHAPFARAVYGD